MLSQCVQNVPLYVPHSSYKLYEQLDVIELAHVVVEQYASFCRNLAV